MGEFIQKIRNQMTEFWGSLSKQRKILLGVVSFLVVFGVSITIFMLTRPSYVPLAQNLSLDEAAAITAQLDELGISWKEENDTSVILVPKSDLSNAKMSLTVEGVLSKQDFTWTQAFATNSFTMTTEDKNKMFLLAQANALAESIKTLDNIDDAVVNLFIPNDSTFLVNDMMESKASVILKLKSGKTLSEAEVDGIVMILANSVKGLDKEFITIVDSTGKELTKPAGDSWEIDVNNQLAMQISVEERLNTKLTDFLTTMYGRNNVKVMSSVELNFDSEETTSRVFSPPIEGEVNGMVRSMTEITENVASSGAEGAPGTDSNGQATNYSQTSTGESGYTKASKTVNYEMNEIVNQLSKAKGTIQNITVAVILNQDVLENQTLTEEHSANLKQLISASSGLDTRVVEISALTFPDESANYDVFSNTAATGFFGIPIWVYILVVVLIVTGLTTFFLLARRKRAQEEAARIEQERLEQEAKELEEIQAGYEDKSSPKYQIEKFIDTNPESVALLLKSWLHED
ncbi:MAG: flagellar M-ring protein FliF [Clostridia bacterium]|nr:flagellar M-ring protein FliF [Clostridia bacterium]